VTTGTALHVRSLAHELLDAVVRHWSTAEGAPLPDRRYLSAGANRGAAWDCEQLTVTLGGIGWGPALDAAPASPRRGSPANVGSVRHAVFYVQLVRCIPSPGRDGKPPTAEALSVAGEQFMRDCGLLSQAMVTWASNVDRSLPDDLASSVQAGVVEGVGPQGGYVAAEVSTIVSAPGLEA